ncbi:MAG TPA: electron transfer flavoprotein subunit beta/FixA family protein [Syntrophorhabdaceae bacterium]|nr:electron transfer flavoprotein subunit beta/FixA family protein [Syntrophorhabdaceae bacterium]
MSLNIVCCIKQVPDTTEVKIDPETNTLIRAGVESISNPYDLAALECAISIKKTLGAKITAISMGPMQAEEVLREALSLGADEAILLSDKLFAGADTLATSYTLAKAIEKVSRESKVDLVLCGKQAIDGDTAQVGPGIATRLEYTQLTYVTEIKEIDLQSVTVKRRTDYGYEIIRGRLPALITVELISTMPHRASLPHLIQSMRTRIPAWSAETIQALGTKIGLKGSPTWVKKISSPPVKQGGPVFVANERPEQAVESCLNVIFADTAFTAKFMKPHGAQIQ